MLIDDPVLADDDLGVNARLVDVAQYFSHPAERAARGSWPARNLDQNHLPGFCLALFAVRYVHVHDQASVERHHEAKIGAVLIELADDRAGPALQDAYDASFGASVAADAFDARDHPVAVHRLIEVAPGDVEVAFPPVSATPSGERNRTPAGGS